MYNPMTANNQNKEYEVVICGGGFAGHTLARQLKLSYPDISIVILEKATFPVAEAAHKVGESTIDPSAHYLADTLQLEEYLQENHFIKHGFRYFWQNGENGDGFVCRAEVGLSEYYPFHAYQLDRGIFENDLCQMNKEMGIQVVDGVSVQDILIHDDALHEIRYQRTDSKASHQVRGRWVIDTMGRRCFLQKKFGLQIKSENPHSSVWFRVKGRLDVADLVPESEQAWHQRVPGKMRYYSTNHLMGPGYWIWLIPLSSGYTSVGIVTSEAFHPFTTYSTHDRAMAWLEENDPLLHNKIQEFEIIDFLKLRNYSYSSQKVFSEQRWACIGNAALFSDPFYSLGGVLIAYENNCVTRMIGLDRTDSLPAETVAAYNSLIINTNDSFITSVQDSYKYFHNSQVFSLAFLWGVYAGWALDFPKTLHSLYLDLDKTKEVNEILLPAFRLVLLMDQLFLEWSEKSKGRFSFDFIDYRRVPFLEEIHALQTQKYNSFEEIKTNYRYVAEQVEELAQAVFLLMIEDLMPEKLAQFPTPLWFNPWAMSLNADQWQQDGLFEPQNPARDVTPLLHQLRAVYTFSEAQILAHS